MKRTTSPSKGQSSILSLHHNFKPYPYYFYFTVTPHNISRDVLCNVQHLSHIFKHLITSSNISIASSNISVTSSNISIASSTPQHTIYNHEPCESWQCSRPITLAYTLSFWQYATLN